MEETVRNRLSASLRLRFSFYLQDLPPQHAEFLFKIRSVERVAAISQFQGDICPVLGLQCVKRGRKEDLLEKRYYLSSAGPGGWH